MRSIRLLVTLGVYAALQSTALYGDSTPFFEEPPPFNFQLYGGFREDYLRVHIGGEYHDQGNLGLFNQVPLANVVGAVGAATGNGTGMGTGAGYGGESSGYGDGCNHRPGTKNFSRMRWQDLKIAQIGASINTSTCHDYYMRATGDYGRILEGEGRVTNRYTYLHALPHHHHHHHHHHHSHHSHHSDKSVDILPSFPLSPETPSHSHHHHRKDDKPHVQYIQLHEVSKLGAKANSGDVCDVSGGLGWKVISGGARSWIAAIIGYSYEHQKLQMTHFRRLKDTHNLIRPEQLEGLKSHYTTRWTGPWGGIDFSAQVECNACLFGNVEWHFCDYRGNGTWSQPGGFSARIHQHARGYGVIGNLGFDWAPWDQWSIGLLFNYQQFSTRRGGNHSEIKNVQPGSTHLIASLPIAKKSPFYRAFWVTYSVSLESAYRF